jgi:hypothetical protein
MRLTVPLAIATLPLLIACKKQSSSNSPCSPETFETYYQANKTIQTSSTGNESGMSPAPLDYDVKSGNNIVFTFNQRYADCPDVMDDEGGRKVVIEIPEGTSAFYVANSQSDCKVILDNDCFCYNGYPHIIERGTISGNKIGINKWLIEATLYSDPSQTDPVYFKKVFTLKN